MRRKRKAQRQAAQEPVPYVDWLTQFREEQLREEIEKASQAETKAEKEQAILEHAKNAANYSAMVSNIMNMKHQTASNIIGNIK